MNRDDRVTGRDYQRCQRILPADPAAPRRPLASPCGWSPRSSTGRSSAASRACPTPPASPPAVEHPRRPEGRGPQRAGRGPGARAGSGRGHRLPAGEPAEPGLVPVQPAGGRERGAAPAAGPDLGLAQHDRRHRRGAQGRAIVRSCSAAWSRPRTSRRRTRPRPDPAPPPIPPPPDPTSRPRGPRSAPISAGREGSVVRPVSLVRQHRRQAPSRDTRRSAPTDCREDAILPSRTPGGPSPDESEIRSTPVPAARRTQRPRDANQDGRSHVHGW